MTNRVTVPLWKDLDPVVNMFSAEQTGNILHIGFAFSKWPHFHRAYLVTICYKNFKDVCASQYLKDQCWMLYFIIFLGIETGKWKGHMDKKILFYTKTNKYPTVCPIYLIKWPFFDRPKKYINVTKNPQILLYMLRYIGY